MKSAIAATLFQTYYKHLLPMQSAFLNSKGARETSEQVARYV